MSSSEFRAGAAMRDITPDRSLPNYTHVWLNRGEGSPLRCHAVVFTDGRRQGALVSCDATFIDRPLLLRMRDACARRTGLAGEWIAVAATHTHAAPAICPSFLSGAGPDPLYLDFLVEQVAEAVAQAQRRMRPSVLAAGTCPTPGWEFNRRLVRPDGSVLMTWPLKVHPGLPPAGPVDGEMGFMAFEEPSGEPLAFVMTYPSHNNCVGEEYHGDLGGCAGDALRAALGAQIPTPFLQGACGDVMWCGGDPPPLHGHQLARRIGADIAARLVPAYRAAARREVERISMCREVMEIADRPFEESTFCEDMCRGADEAARLYARCRYDPEEEAVRALGPTSCPVEVQALGFGEVAVCTNPAELFVEFGLEIRRRSPFAVTLVAELTNGYCGYVPTAAAFAQDGYEVHRTVYTSRLEKAAGRKITEASLGLLERLRHGRPQQ